MVILKIIKKFWEELIGPDKLLLVVLSTFALGSEFRGTHDHRLPFHDSGSQLSFL
jgi:hypothetical protein